MSTVTATQLDNANNALNTASNVPIFYNKVYEAQFALRNAWIATSNTNPVDPKLATLYSTYKAAIDEATADLPAVNAALLDPDLLAVVNTNNTTVYDPVIKTYKYYKLERDLLIPYITFSTKLISDATAASVAATNLYNTNPNKEKYAAIAAGAAAGYSLRFYSSIPGTPAVLQIGALAAAGTKKADDDAAAAAKSPSPSPTSSSPGSSPSSLIKSSVSSSASSSTDTPTSAPTSNFWTTTTGILAIILCIVLLIIGFVLIRMMIPKKTKSSTNSYIDNPMHSKGGYFYLD